jgi:hypothetical protein
MRGARTSGCFSLTQPDWEFPLQIFGIATLSGLAYQSEWHPILDKGAKITRTKWWKLKGEAQQTLKERMIAEGPWGEEGEVDSMWVKMAFCIRKVAREVLGVTKGKKQEPKDTWSWKKDVEAIKEGECYNFYPNLCLFTQTRSIWSMQSSNILNLHN